jgi:dipeptidyl aminopeptidase/acylaminoacyl peptidase
LSPRRLAIVVVCLASRPLTPTIGFAQNLPATIHAEGVPPVPADLDAGIDLYRFWGSVSFQGWLGGTRRVVYLYESEGTQQVFLRLDPDEPEQQLTSSGRSVAWVSPHPSRDRLVVALDRQGNENYQLQLRDLTTGVLQSFTNDHWRNTSVLWSPRGRLLALSSNARNGKDRDLYVVKPPDGFTGRRIKDAAGTCVAQDWSPDERRVAAVEFRPDWNASWVHLIDVETREVETIRQPAGLPVKRSGVRWSKDGTALYWLTNRDSDFLQLARYDLGTNREVPLTSGIPWDIEEYDISGNGRTIVLVANEDGRSRLHVIDARTGQARPTPRFADGLISNVSFRGSSQEFAFTWSSPHSPPGIYSYDLATRWRTEWARPRKGSPRAGSGDDPALIRYPSFDGLPIPAFVRLPGPWFPGPHPVLIDLHGGPDSQARPEFSSLSDYLLNELGIALIAPNVRGSSGYGQAYEKLDNGRNREDAVRDVGALIDWIATQPDLDASRVAVRGGSYGGYLALATLMKYGDRLRGAIDLAGISHFETFLEDAPALAIDGWRDEYGDERDPATLKFFREISPLSHADKIRRPVLVMHGENDPRVKVGEADRIVAAVRAGGVPVWYVRFDGEGHHFQRRDHSLYQQHAQILFLSRYLLPEG